MLGTPLSLWLTFAVIASVAIATEIFLHRGGRLSSFRAALMESSAWIALSLCFNLWIYFVRGHEPALQFFTAYVVEQSLSVDNVLLFLIIFRSFHIPAHAQHRVLYFGVVGAILMRAAFVFAGVSLLTRLHFVIYIFGALLAFAGLKMAVFSEHNPDPEKNWLVHIARRILPVTHELEGEAFFIRRDAVRYATPLFLALVAVEAMDIIFAVDSVPAVLAITRDAFIAYSSNIFAVLGLRAIYFALAGALPRIRFLHQGLAAILFFVGAKMVLSAWFEIPTLLSLAIVAVITTATVIISFIFPAAIRKPTQ